MPAQRPGPARPPATPTAAGHYFDPTPTAASRPRTVSLALPDGTVELHTDTGVFSAERVDPGTRLLLLDGPAPPGGGHLVDLGCGYGPIALTLARRDPTATVWALDVNERAVACCARNAERLGLANVQAVVVPADDPMAGVPAEVVVRGLWSNPPIRIGKAALHILLAQSLGRLAPGASAHLVVQKHLGADSLQRWLTEQGWPTERRTSRGGYRLLDVTVPSPGTEADPIVADLPGGSLDTVVTDPGTAGDRPEATP